MSRQKMLFVTGLLTFLTLSNAGGDHVKGGHHIKGGSEAVQQTVSQEEIVPSPYSFNIKTDAAYGTKIVREETGDSDGRVKGSYTVSNPRGTQRIVEYTADDSGFHANIKTSEPNIKTHSPSNAVIEAIPKQSSSAILQPVKTVLATAPVVTSFSLGDSQIKEPAVFPVIAAQIREPTATPVLSQPFVKISPVADKSTGRKTIKTIRRKIVSSGQTKTVVPTEPQSSSSVSGVKTIEDFSDIVQAQPESKKVAPAPKPVTKGVGAKSVTKSVVQQPPRIIIDGSVNDAGKEVIVLEDGTIVDASDTSRRLGQASSSSSSEKNKENKPSSINQDFKMVRGSQIPSSDIRADFGVQDASKLDQELRLNTQSEFQNAGPIPRGSVIVPGGPGGASFTLTESEIQNILSSGGVVEFPSGAGVGSFGARNVVVSQTNPLIESSQGITRMNTQSYTQTSAARKPTVAIASSTDRKRTEFKSQTSTALREGQKSGTGDAVVVPGGPGGASFTLTESEIQKILATGGVVEFPYGTGLGTTGGRDILSQTKPSTGISPGITSIRSDVQSLVKSSGDKKPIAGVSLSVDGARTDFKSQLIRSGARPGQVSGSSIVVPGGPGGASFTLTESEIQRILSTGGVLEFPSNSGLGPIRDRNVLKSQTKPSIDIPQRTFVTRSKIQSLTQKSKDLKPIAGVLTSTERKDFKSQSSPAISGAVYGARGSIVVPGGPGGASFSLTESEIQKILASGGIVEFPSDAGLGPIGAKAPSPGFAPGPIATRSNSQTLTSGARKPTTGILSRVDQKRTDFKSQTSTTVSGAGRGQVSGAGGSIVVPGGPGGALFSLTESEIQKILASGGVVEFPSDAGLGPIGAKDVLTAPSPGFAPGPIATRSNSQTLTSGARKPTTGILSRVDQKRTDFKSQTSSTVSGAGRGQVSGAGGSIVVPGGPGGALFSLTETEIQKILASGGVVEFPSDAGLGPIVAKDVLTAPSPGPISTRSNTQTLSQTFGARKPSVRITSSDDQKRTDFKSQTSTVVSGAGRGQVSAPGGPIVVPGGPGGASFSLTESEIQKILASGGIVEFPSNSGLGPLAAKDVIVSQTIPSPGSTQGSLTRTRTNINSISQNSNARKPSIGSIRKPISGTSQDSNQIRSSVQSLPVEPVIVQGERGAPTLTLTKSEIEKILSTGGILEIPSGSDKFRIPSDDKISEPRVSIVRNQPQSSAGLVSSAQDSSRSARPGISSYADVPSSAQIPQTEAFLTQERVQPSFPSGASLKQQTISQVQEPVSVLQQEEQIKLEQIPTFEAPAIQTSVADSKDQQVQVKLVSDLEPKPVVSGSALIQEQVSGYVPQLSLISPFNYRLPQHRDSSSPIIQEQQKLEQILV